jgi:DNA-binding beta-propeller fold protein YncE
MMDFPGGLMSIRSRFSYFLIVAAFTLSAGAFAQGAWTVEKTFHVGGEGGFDYITLDATSHRLYVPRSTHTMVVNAESGETIADISGQKHNHGVAVVPELSRGFISDGAGSIVIFDLKTNAVLATVAAKDDADGIIYDKSTGLILVSCGDAGVLVTLKADADPKTATIDAPIELGGKPEFLAADGAGKVYVNLEDKDQIAVVDLRARKVLAHWPVAPGGSPVGLSIDTEKHRLFVGCRKPQKLLVMSTDDGKVVGDLPIAAGVDATRWDGHQAFASTREGKLSVAEGKSGKWETVQTVTTGLGTKTMDVDSAAHKIYLPTAEFDEAKPGARPTAKPGTFMIVVVARP